MFSSFPTSKDPHWGNVALGVVTFCLLLILVPLGNLSALLVISTLAWLVLFPVAYWLTQLDEGRPAHEIFDLFTQSWSLYGCSLFLLPGYLVAASQWVLRPETLPTWAWQWWWTPVAIVGGVVISLVFGWLERGRYDPLSLDEPAKRYFNNVLVPFFMALVLARVLPMLFAPWSYWTWVAIGLVFAWVLLMVVDGLRYFTGLPDWAPHWAKEVYQQCKLVPETQHPLYDKVENRLIS